MQWFDGTLCYDSHYKLDYFMQYTFSFLIYSTSIHWVLALCQTLGDKEYHGQKKKKKEREREIQKLFFYRAHVLVGEIKNWGNSVTDIKSFTILHMLWKSKEFIR